VGARRLGSLKGWIIEVIPFPKKEKTTALVHSMAVIGFAVNPVESPKTACLTGCSYKSPSAQTDHTAMEAQGYRALSGTCDRLTSAGEQLKSGSASHLVVREDNCGMAVRGSEWTIIGCRMFPQL
jgi:hypothetical protein